MRVLMLEGLPCNPPSVRLCLMGLDQGTCKGFGRLLHCYAPNCRGITFDTGNVSRNGHFLGQRLVPVGFLCTAYQMLVPGAAEMSLLIHGFARG